MTKVRGRTRRTQIDGQFAAREIKMIESPAFVELSLSAHRVLARLEIELALHGGMDNGRLPVTYQDFEGYGIDRHSIAPAIRELIALGFVEITEKGRAGNAEWRSPNRFRLTYKHTRDAGPTHEWKRIYTAEQAANRARAARLGTAKNRTPVGVSNQRGVGSPQLGPLVKSPTTASPEQPPLHSISRGGGLGCGGKIRRTRERLDQPAQKRRSQMATTSIKPGRPPR